MNKTQLLILPFLFVTSLTLKAQNCKFKVNEVDKFTNKYIKVTTPEKVIGTFYTAGEFSIKKIDTSYFFIFNYVLSSYSKFEPYSIKKGALLQFLLENGEIVTLSSADDINGTRKTIAGIPTVYNCYLTNTNYPITRSQIDAFFKSKVKTIRFYRTESNGKEDYLDNVIKRKNQDDIQNLIKCVL
jgi:hypothetical protein